MIKNDNILALASPSGVGAISLIRISGPESITIVDKFFKGVENIKLIYQDTNKVQLGYIVEQDRVLSLIHI